MSTCGRARARGAPGRLIAASASAKDNKDPRTCTHVLLFALDAASGEVVLQEFEASAEGMVASMRARYPEAADAELRALWEADRAAMR